MCGINGKRNLPSPAPVGESIIRRGRDWNLLLLELLRRMFLDGQVLSPVAVPVTHA